MLPFIVSCGVTRGLVGCYLLVVSIDSIEVDDSRDINLTTKELPGKGNYDEVLEVGFSISTQDSRMEVVTFLLFLEICGDSTRRRLRCIRIT